MQKRRVAPSSAHSPLLIRPPAAATPRSPGMPNAVRRAQPDALRAARPATRSWWWSLWPLGLLLALLAMGGLWLWHAGPQLVAYSAYWQKTLSRTMTALLQSTAQAPTRAGLSLLGLSLLYGVVHAVGPGHGKVVITTYLATHPSRLKSSLMMTFAASVVQASVAILLVSIVLGVLHLSSRMLHLSGYWLEKGSYLLVAGLGALLALRALRRLWRTVGALRAPALTYQRLALQPHVHSASCGCAHAPLSEEAHRLAAESWRTRVIVVLSMGLRPCSGALMMLLFAHVIGVYGWGVLAALAMALGTSLTLSSLALAVHSFRALAQRMAGARAAAPWRAVAAHALALGGGVLLIAIGALLWLSARPAIAGGLRMLAG